MGHLEKAINDLKTASNALKEIEPLCLSSSKELSQEYLKDMVEAKFLVDKWYVNFLHFLLNTESKQSSAPTERK